MTYPRTSRTLTAKTTWQCSIASPSIPHSDLTVPANLPLKHINLNKRILNITHIIIKRIINMWISRDSETNGFLKILLIFIAIYSVSLGPACTWDYTQQCIKTLSQTTLKANVSVRLNGIGLYFPLNIERNIKIIINR